MSAKDPPVPIRGIGTIAGQRAREWHRRSLQALLFAAVALPLAMVAASAWWSWQETWRGAEQELARSADAAAEYAGRVLGAHRLTAVLVNTMLAGLSDEEIRMREAELHERLRSLLPLVPMTNTIALSDRNAIALLTANIMPVPRVNIEDREWVRALRPQDFPPVHISAVTTGRIDDNFFFGVSIRRALTGNGLPSGNFDGVVNISVNPNQLAEGLGTITRGPTDVVALLRSDGELLARNSALATRVPPLPSSSPLLAAAAGDATRGLYRGPGRGFWPDRADGQQLIVAFRRVGDMPVYATVSRPASSIIGHWLEAVLAQLAIALPATLGLAGLVLLVRRGERSLAAGEAEFRATFERTLVGAAQVNPETGRFLRVNQRFSEITGYTEAELVDGMTFSDVTHPEDREVDAAAFRAAMASSGAYQTEKRYLRKDGSIAWVLVSVALIPSPTPGGPRRTVAAVQDVTERRTAEARQTLLVREVDHRAKNVLAVVQSIVRLTRAEDPRMFATAVEGRVRALARAHELLARDGWRGADLREVVAKELAPFTGGGRVVLEGPAIELTPDFVQPLSMALHELATNAARHGALSVVGGSVEISWRGDGPQTGGALRLIWVERNGPTVATAPQRRGFGQRVIEATVQDQLGGSVSFSWNPAGLRCELVVRLAPRVANAAPSAARASSAPSDALQPSLAGCRVLVVEDEPLVAMDLAAALAALGCEVVGPVSTLNEALCVGKAETAAGRLGAAVLDVNLHGAMSFPLAEFLAERRVPFVYATGYGELPELGGAAAPCVLRKPVAPAELADALHRAIRAQRRKDDMCSA